MSCGDFDDWSGLLHAVYNGVSFSGLLHSYRHASGLQQDGRGRGRDGDRMRYKKILTISGLVILAVGGVCKLISILGSSKDDPGNGLGSRDDSGDGFGLHVQEQDDYYDDDEFGLYVQEQDDYHNDDEFGLYVKEQDDYHNDDEFGLCVKEQDDYHNDVSGLIEDFFHGFGLSDENFGSQWRSIVEEEESVGTHSGSIVEIKAERVETPSVLLRQKSAKRIKHYCSTQKILLVGEGNFSFSASLAESFGYATNMVATSLDSYDFILRNYGHRGWLNLSGLEKKGCKLIHEVDATKMSYHLEVGSMAFDIIVYNFPHAGFIKFESRVNQIKRHRNLVRSFFENAKRMLSIGGEIHVSHKTNGFFNEWKIEELAAQCGLHIREKTTFNLSDYPGYETKYGFGGNKNFDCYPSMTYKFALSIKGLPNRSSWAAQWD